MSVRFLLRFAWIIVIVAAAAACHAKPPALSGFPGLSIKVTCPAGSTSARYEDTEGKYPGERASGNAVDGRFLADVGELPLACVDRGANAYRMYQSNDSGVMVIGVSQSSTAARLWVVSQPRQAKIRRAERPLLSTEWDDITNHITALRFWTQPARLIQPNRESWRGGWTLEGYSGDHYHRVSRFYLDDALTPIGNAFLDLARPLFAGAK